MVFVTILFLYSALMSSPAFACHPVTIQNSGDSVGSSENRLGCSDLRLQSYGPIDPSDVYQYDYNTNTALIHQQGAIIQMLCRSQGQAATMELYDESKSLITSGPLIQVQCLNVGQSGYQWTVQNRVIVFADCV